MRRIVRNFDVQDTRTSLGSLETASQIRVLDAALDYYQYRMPKDERKPGDLKKRYADLLKIRFELPTAKAAASVRPRRGPHQDRAPGYASIGFAINDTHSDSGLIRVRPAYYDALDSAASHVPNSELSMAEVILRAKNNRVTISKASIFRVEAVNGSVTRLPGDNGRSWAMALGFIEQSPACVACLVARFEGDFGRSIQLGKNAFVGAYFGGAIQDGRNSQGNLFVRTTGYINLAPNDRLTIQARFESRYHLDGYLENEDLFSLTTRFRLAGNYDMRLVFQKNVSTEASLSLGYYW